MDRHDFIKTLAEACEKSGWQIAECLHLGKPKGARTNLHKFMNGAMASAAEDARDGTQIQLNMS